MEIRSDDDQRLEAAGFRPAPGLDGIAKGVGGGMIDIDAAGKPTLMLRHEPRDLDRPRGWIDATDEQPLAAAGGEQIERIVDPKRPASQGHDSVSVADRYALFSLDLMDEPQKAAANRGNRKAQNQESDTPPPPPRPEGRRGA